MEILEILEIKENPIENPIEKSIETVVKGKECAKRETKVIQKSPIPFKQYQFHSNNCTDFSSIQTAAILIPFKKTQQLQFHSKKYNNFNPVHTFVILIPFKKSKVKNQKKKKHNNVSSVHVIEHLHSKNTTMSILSKQLQAVTPIHSS